MKSAGANAGFSLDLNGTLFLEMIFTDLKSF